MNDDDLLTACEIARAIGRSHNTVAGWCRKGKLKPAGEKVNRFYARVKAYRLADARAVDAAMGRFKRPGEPKRIKPASAPTSARPGSEDRIAVYEMRVARGEAVFCPGDTSLRRTA